ncbi:stage III sporulation protein SpoIIIAB [Clostridium massiliodielmoense]|uniref:stage III sporulation protein SpoIIIAB n=1 Tax=Clostridium massiliodielmoense TaxID=1776385 RepID=UPI00016686F8|nr:stage III sporulation protein SpoIIIAB [Clostridium massiliodielmoense]EDS77917.1 stage III sporulation protein AB [Clostridium botulinum C str. Eklund]KEH95920.1 stage III sporulation protein AB [Clostridium botulinum C/D str. BKT12695]NEZ50108.1 stage III sporulation protein SpoAB [Clostridium botulinum]
MYFKILGSILVLVSSSLLGFIYGENLKKRFFQLEEMEQALYQLKNEIVYTHNSLPDIFMSVGSKGTKPIGDIFKRVSNLLYEHQVESVHEGFKKALSENKKQLNLKKYDIDILLNLSKSLGESDIEGQQNILTLTIRNIKSQLDSAKNVMEKNIKMYRYLGFSFGAILVIMML